MSILKKIHYNSPVILSYTFIALFALLLNVLTSGVSNHLVFSVYKSSFSDVLGYVRLFGHIIGHADFNHFFNNFLMILMVGPMLEEKYGSLNILYVILITALVTGLLHIIFIQGSLLGASGVVFAFIILSSFVNIKEGKIPLTLILAILIFIGKEFVLSVGTSDNISRVTHIIGGGCGALAGYLFNKKIFHKKV